MKNSKIIICMLCVVFVGATDNDRDGYSDAQEIHARTDPNNHKSIIYSGLWPYNINKNKIQDPGFGECPNAVGCECTNINKCPEQTTCQKLFIGSYCIPSLGITIPRFKGIDQFGEIVDIYDFANQGKNILIEIGSAGATPSQELSAWRSYLHEDVKRRKWWKEKFEKMHEIIDNGEVLWIHVLHLNKQKEAPTASTVSSWYESYSHDNIVILADPEAKLKQWVRPTGMPTIVLLNEKMELIVHSTRGIEDAFNFIIDQNQQPSNSDK